MRGRDTSISNKLYIYSYLMNIVYVRILSVRISVTYIYIILGI